MPKRKSDATEGDALGTGHEAPEVPVDPERAAAEQAATASVPETPPETTERAEAGAAEEPGYAAAGKAPSAELSTPWEAAEPGSPEAAAPPGATTDPAAAADPYREPEIAAAPAAHRDRDQDAYPASTEAGDDGHDDEGGWSFAAKALAVLVLLIAGGVLALWGGPRLAPHLPSGLSGVAAWLTPGAGDAEARVAELEARLGSRIDGLETQLGGLAAPDDIAAAVNEAVTRLDGEIAAVKQAIAEDGGAGAAEQVARLQSALDGQAAELAALKDQLGAAPASAASDEVASRIDVYEAGLAGLRAEVGTLQENVAGLATRVDGAVLNARAEIDAARTRVEEIESEADTRLSAAQADADRAMIASALASGTPFEPAVQSLGDQAGTTVPQALVDAAATGVPTMTQLRDEFPEAAHAAIRASIMAGAGEGVLARTRAFFEAQVASRSLSPREGPSPDAVLSRVEERLKQDDLDGALAEAEGLASEAQAAMASWLDAARRRAAVVDGLATLDTAAPATN